MTLPTPSEEVLALHRNLSPEAAELLSLAYENPDEVAALDRAREDLPGWLQYYPYALQPLPTLVGGAKLEEIRRATTELSRIVKRVPFSVFGGDPERVAAFYDMESPEWVDVILSEPNGIDGALTRGDFLDTDRGFQCVEYNMSAYLGGWQIRFLTPDQTASPIVVEALRRGGRPARAIDPLHALFRHVVERALDLDSYTDDRVSTFLLLGEAARGTGIRELFESLQDDYAELLEAEFPWLTGSFLVGWREELVPIGRGFEAGGEPVHAVIEYNDMFTDPQLLQASKDRVIDLYNGAASQIIGDKRNLALLSERYETADLTDDERELVQRHIPWTRLTDLTETTFEGREVSFPGFLLAERERLVLKAARGSRGQNVFIGRETEDDQWQRAVKEAQGSSAWIVQELVPSRPYWYRATDGELRPHSVVWGLFAFGDSYGGGFLRMMPTGGGSVINSARGATEGLILEIEAL